MPNSEKPPARPIFRKAATGVAVICFVLAVAFAIIAPEEGLFGPGVCVVVGAIMATIAATGYWPPRRSH